jgi:hypothetical protein
VITPPLSAQDLQAAAEVHQELGAEYSDAVVESFLAKVDARLDERVRERLAELAPPRMRLLANLTVRRRNLISGTMIGTGGLGVPFFLHLYSATYPWRGGPSPGTPRDIWSALLIVSATTCGAGIARIFRRRR